jgi:hypothetical protein
MVETGMRNKRFGSTEQEADVVLREERPFD